MFLFARPLTRLVLIASLVPTNAVAQTIPFAARPLGESATRAAQELAQAERQPSGSDKKLLLTGAALVGGGIGLMAAGLGEECTLRGSPYNDRYCKFRSEDMAWGAVISAGVGSVVLAKAAMGSASKGRILGIGAALLGSGIGLMAIGEVEECGGYTQGPGTTRYTSCRSWGGLWLGGPTVAVAGAVLLANVAQRRTVPITAPRTVPPDAVAGVAPLADLSGDLKLGDTIAITETDGRRTEGKVTALTPSSLTVADDQMDRTFPVATLRRITVKDSKWNGALVGFVAGTIPATLLIGSFAHYVANDPDSCRQPCTVNVGGIIAGGLLLGGLPGAAIGAAIDAAIEKTIDVSRPQGARVTVLPVISPGRQAVLVSIRF